MLHAPPVLPVARRVGRGGRLLAAFIAGVCLTLLVLAANLTPSPAGHGTHRGLGLPPCGWVVAFDKPCPTCGMTTSWAHAANLDVVSALRAQPLGAALALLTTVIFWGAVHVALTGSRLGAVGATMATPRALWVLGGLAALAWAYKLATWGG